MHVTGTIEEPQLTVNGGLRLLLNINEKDKCLEEYESIKGETLTIDLKKLRQKRSIRANDYFWQLVDKMAKVLGSDKWTIYLMQIEKYGVFVDLQVQEMAVATLEEHFRYSQRLQEWVEDDITWYTLRGFYGSSEYNTKEMSELIDGTVRDAREIGIETMTDEEIAHLISQMKGGKNESMPKGTPAY